MNRPAMAVLALALIVVPALSLVASVNRDLGTCTGGSISTSA